MEPNTLQYEWKRLSKVCGKSLSQSSQELKLMNHKAAALAPTKWRPMLCLVSEWRSLGVVWQQCTDAVISLLNYFQVLHARHRWAQATTWAQ